MSSNAICLRQILCALAATCGRCATGPAAEGRLENGRGCRRRQRKKSFHAEPEADVQSANLSICGRNARDAAKGRPLRRVSIDGRKTHYVAAGALGRLASSAIGPFTARIPGNCAAATGTSLQLLLPALVLLLATAGPLSLK